jgi:hypothetical protein
MRTIFTLGIYRIKVDTNKTYHLFHYEDIILEDDNIEKILHILQSRWDDIL